MSFNYSVQLSDPANVGGSADPILVYDLQQALGIWSQYISGNGTLIARLNIANTQEGRESGGPTSSASIGQNSNGLSVYESSAQYELSTGNHVAGTTSDISITIDPGYFKYLDMQAGLTYDSQVPNNEYNPIVVFLHEIMHGFGMSGWYSQSGALPGNYESNFDSHIQIAQSGNAFLTGTNAEAVYGGSVPLTTASTAGENYYHFGNILSDFSKTPSTVQDPLTLDLMNGIVLFYNYQYKISLLDLAVLTDLGYSTTFVSPQTIKTADLGVLRAADSNADAITVATNISMGQSTLTDYINHLIAHAQSLTVPALITYDFFFGKTPASGGLDFLTAFATQIQTPAGGGFSVVNTFVNLAATDAINPSSSFAGTFGTSVILSETTFFNAVYTQLFGHAASQAAIDNYFKTQTFNLPNGSTITGTSFDFYREYVRESLPVSQQTAPNLENGARGAVAGTLLYFAEADPTTQYAQATAHFLQDAAVETPAYQMPLIGTYLASSTPHLT